ncbi:hypothetical protein DUNSADRAFT_3345 [Dunaliella salina]|uniref:Dolichol kinase n=1 Tax=Dunaliella salina TaxID=3046 RepID=A0ABQ7GU59_DUNSA|nr:hypothetical protein DUNSADRAFT_3345 [Dunaliella salina]|eukprot:KAF5838150.1 hypothetical protein DUNSADRAFT_3345 [Dunaliella salina]
MRNLYALVVTGAVMVALLGTIGVLAFNRVMQSDVSRKLMHTSLVFMLLWPFYEDSPYSRFCAASLIAGISLYFAAVGLGFFKDHLKLTIAATRTGRPKDLLKGPVLYGLVHTAVTAIYWRDSPVGIMSLCALCGGDGLAVFGGLLGRILGLPWTLPWNSKKSWAGSIAFLLGSFYTSVPLMTLFVDRGFFHLEAHQLLRGCAICSAVGMLVESLPILEYDNLTVPAAVAFTSQLVMSSAASS